MKKYIFSTIALCTIMNSHQVHAQIATNVYKDQAIPSSQEVSYPAWAYSEYQAASSTAIANDDLYYDEQNRTYSRAPKNFFTRTNWGRFNLTRYRNPGTTSWQNWNEGAMYIAHRGLVDLKLGINENTLDAVQHAMARGIHMVELDIQASSDGKPMVTHDDNLIRTTGANTNVANETKANISGIVTKIANPAPVGARGLRTDAIPKYCASSGNKLLALGDMWAVLSGVTGYSRASVTGGLGTCNLGTSVTYFLDPKNLASGKAAMGFMASANSGTDKRRWYMKTYDNFWASNPNDAAALVKASLPAGTNTAALQVMPVISVRNYLDPATPDYTGAVNYAKGITRAWTAQGFSVAAIEFPGAWDAKWLEFVSRFYTEIRKDSTTYYGKNPVQNYNDASGIARQFRLLPVLSYGYRFPDFKIADQRYTWSMQGYAQADNSNRNRAILGAQAGITGNRCRSGLFITDTSDQGPLYQTGCFVTHDFPHWETEADKDNRVSSFLGAPQTSFDSLPQ